VNQLTQLGVPFVVRGGRPSAAGSGERTEWPTRGSGKLGRRGAGVTVQAVARYLADGCIAQQHAARPASRTSRRPRRAVEADVGALTAVASGSGTGQRPYAYSSSATFQTDTYAGPR
jgi:hypothetical protein